MLSVPRANEFYFYGVGATGNGRRLRCGREGMESTQCQHSTLTNGCFQTVVLEKMLESLLDNKEIKSVNPQGNQP